MVFFEAMHIDKIVTLKPISYMFDYQYNVLLKSQFCNVWSQRGSHSGCSLQLINTVLLYHYELIVIALVEIVFHLIIY